VGAAPHPSRSCIYLRHLGRQAGRRRIAGLLERFDLTGAARKPLSTLKRRIPGGHIQLQFAEPDALRAAVSMIPDATPDDDQLILQVPGDGSIASLRRVLNELDDARITVEHLSIHTPDLDDVFFAVTGHAAIDPTTRQEEEALQP